MSFLLGVITCDPINIWTVRCLDLGNYDCEMDPVNWDSHFYTISQLPIDNL